MFFFLTELHIHKFIQANKWKKRKHSGKWITFHVLEKLVQFAKWLKMNNCSTLKHTFCICVCIILQSWKETWREVPVKKSSEERYSTQLHFSYNPEKVSLVWSLQQRQSEMTITTHTLTDFYLYSSLALCLLTFIPICIEFLFHRGITCQR